MTREEALQAIKAKMDYYENDKRLRGALETLIPELAESEDERIRREIIDFIQWAEDRGMTRHDYHQAKRPAVWISYLEKQKEEEGYEAIPVESTLEYKLGFKAGKESEKQKESLRDFIDDFPYSDQKEQKPNCKYKCPLTDEQLMATDFWKVYLKESLIPGAKPNKQDIEFLLPTARNYFSLIMKEVCTICKDWSNGYREGLESGEQKSIERSEEDEKTINDACCWIAEYAGYLMDKNYGKASMLMCLTEKLKSLHTQSKFECSGATTNGEPIPAENHSVDIPLAEWSEDIIRKAVKEVGLTQHQIDWFKTNVFPPKQEWSEENEKDVAHIIRILDDCYAYGKHDLSKTDHENLVGTLKSLRLQPKLEWSEEDEHRRDGIIQWLREYQWQFNPKYDSLSIESIESLIDWFKSIRPSWKPTEEQMGALDYAYGELFKRGDVGHNILGPLQKLCDECRRRIKELSKQIKKS